MTRLLGSLALLMAAGVAWSTTFVPLTVEQRVAAADAVVEVTVKSAHAAWENGRLVTYYGAEAHRWFKGGTGPDVLFALPGGELAAFGQHVFASPRLEVGARYVLLLGPDTGPDGARGVVMLGEGVFGTGPGASDEPLRVEAFGDLSP